MGPRIQRWSPTGETSWVVCPTAVERTYWCRFTNSFLYTLGKSEKKEIRQNCKDFLEAKAEAAEAERAAESHDIASDGETLSSPDSSADENEDLDFVKLASKVKSERASSSSSSSGYPQPKVRPDRVPKTKKEKKEKKSR